MMNRAILVCVVLLVLILVAPPAGAQLNWDVHNIYPWYQAKVTFADMDNDGDLDIWAIGYLDVSYFENNGFGAFAYHAVPCNWNYGIDGDAADFDGDGDLDGVGTSWSGDELAWFRNDGNDIFTYTPITSFDAPYAVKAVDLDQDGDIDILATGDGTAGTNNWFENDSTGHFTRHIIQSGITYPRVADAVDIDDDGDLDVIGAGTMMGRWYENDSLQNFTVHTLPAITQQWSAGRGLDFDQDGDIDLIYSSFWADIINWYENDGNQNFTMHPLAIALDGAEDFDIADFDNDGDWDVVTGSTMQDWVGWYENDGNMNFLQHIIPYYLDYPQTYTAADYDNDGDMDFVALPNEDRILLFENLLNEPYGVRLTLTPADSVVTVPPGGGSFQFTLELENSDTIAYIVDLWTDITLPNGTIYPVATRTNLTLPEGASVVRTLTQFIPGSAMPGHYFYNGHVRDHSTWYTYWEDSFPFEKLSGVAQSNHNRGWALYGWDENAPMCAIPMEFAFSAYPNPFNPVSTLSFTLPQTEFVTLTVCDVQGRVVARLLDRRCEAGVHETRFDATHLSSGVYLAHLKAGSFERTQKLLLTK